MKPLTRVVCMKSVRRAIPACLLLLLVAMFMVPPLVPAQLVNGRFITSVSTWEVFDTVGSSRKITRGFQSAIFDIAQGDFSLHTHFQAAATLDHQLDELPDYRLYYLYGQWKNLGGIADLSVGRLPYFAGVGLGTVDGASATFRFDRNAYRLTLYGGANVPADMTLKGYGNIKRQFATGGQFIISSVPNLRASLSYMNRERERASYWTIRPEVNAEPLAMFVTPDPEKEQYAGADVSYTLDRARFYGRYDYDVNFKNTQRGQLGVRYNLRDDLIVTADFIHRAPRIPYNSFFAQFNLDNVDEYEVGGDYYLNPTLRVFGRGAYVQYSGDRSFRYSAGIGRSDLQLEYRGNTGYAGELNTVSLEGVYPLWDNKIAPNAALSWVRYRLDANASVESAVAAALGATLRPMQFFSLDLQGQWVNNVVYKSDFRFFGKLNIWFSERLNLLD